MIALTFRSGSYTITFKGSTGTPPTKNITVEIPDGDATQTIVTDSSVNTLTNKTIDSAGVGNSITLDADNASTTITNIDNDEIKAGAAIDATKIHDGTVDNTEFGHLNGVTSNIQTQLNTDAQNLADHEAEVTGAHAASAISFNNVASGLTATTAQAAIDEVEGRVDVAETDITNIEAKTDFITVTQPVNLDTMESGITTNATDITNIELKTDQITVTQPVNLDTIESDTALNNTHRATVTGNPHAVTKTEVGLGNVPDVDATNASNISSGTLADTRLSSNVDLLDANQTITGEKTFEKQVWAEGTAINNNASSTLAEPNKTIVPLTGTPSVTDIVTITATTVTSERVIVLRNDTTSTFVVRSTGNIALSGDDIELAQNATLILQYDLSATKWLVVGGSGAGGGNVKAEFYTHATLPATLTIGKFYVVDISGGNASATMPTISADSNGKSLEIWPVNNPGAGTVTLTAGGSDSFNDADLGTDTVYVLDVGKARFVADSTGTEWHVADAYWNAGSDVGLGNTTINGDLTVSGVINGGAATANQAGTVKLDRVGTIYLAVDETASVTDIATNGNPSNSGFKFTNLTIGQWYELAMCAFTQVETSGSATDYTALLARHNGTTILTAGIRDDAAADTVNMTSSTVVKFKATATTITFNIDINNLGSVNGNGTSNETFAQLTELNNVDSTDVGNDFT